MKSFLAGLALALGAAVFYSKRQRGRIGYDRQPLAPEPRSSPAEAVPVAHNANSPQLIGLVSSGGSVAVGRQSAATPAGTAEEVLNSATRQQLLSVYGIGPVLADRIIQHRPYTVAYDVVRQGIIPEKTFEELRKQLLEPPGA